MANKKFTELAAVTTLGSTDILPVVVDPGTSPVSKKIAYSDLRAAILASPTVTGTMGAAAITASGTVTANLFSGSGASLTSIPESAVTNLVSDLAGKSSTSHSHNLQDLGGAVTSSQLPANITGRTSVSAEQFKGVTNAGNIIDLQNAAAVFLTITSGASWALSNNATSVGPFALPGPAGYTTRGADDMFLVVERNGKRYAFRGEDWS